MLKNEEIAIMYRKKEFGITHTLNIDEGTFNIFKIL